MAHPIQEIRFFISTMILKHLTNRHALNSERKAQVNGLILEHIAENMRK
jgi:hypothetical protein